MLRALTKIACLLLVMITGALAIHWYGTHDATQQKLLEAQAKNQELQKFVERLSDEKRVAEVIVTEQKTVNNVLQTSLLFVEYARDGQTSLPPRSFTIEGKFAHIDAMVIKFDHNFVEENDPLRGHSIALFTRIYGDHQSPANAAMIDQPGKIPDIYKGTDPRVGEFEQSLWNEFWQIYSDENYRKSKGVRTLSGQGVWGPFEAEKLYTITLESDGGLNLTAAPQRGIYREALHQKNVD
jgi:hypothetical protein